jgi:hypothetical protein
MTTRTPAPSTHRSQPGRPAGNAGPAREATKTRRKRLIFGLPDESPVGPRFGLLLLILISAYVISAFTSDTLTAALQVVLYLVAIALAVRTSRLSRGSARLVIAIAVIGSAGAVALALSGSQAGLGVANVWTALMLLFGVVLILGRVFAQREVTMQSIFGAVSAYIIIGLLFASIYAAMYRFGNGHFFVNGETDDVKTFQYFSFTTLTTLGYGDYTAAGSGGQAVAVMEALLGQVFLATLVARLVAAFRGPRMSAVETGTPPGRPDRASRPGGVRRGAPGRGPRPSFRRPRVRKERHSP